VASLPHARPSACVEPPIEPAAYLKRESRVPRFVAGDAKPAAHNFPPQRNDASAEAAVRTSVRIKTRRRGDHPFNSAIARRASLHARWTTHDMEQSSRRASAAISSTISAGK
jgi:hypothetical protein